VEKSGFANLPTAQTCMNCHSLIKTTSPLLAVVRKSYETNQPVPWIQIHQVPDFVYFNHSIHINRGVSCVECHGRVDQMDVVTHAKPLSMGFCLDCHRDPAAHIRPTDKVTDLGWTWSTNGVEAAHLQTVEGKKLVEHLRVESLQSCSACHR
jgi:hypothetical protein